MRVLGIHSKYFRSKVRAKALEGAEKLTKYEDSLNIDEECLVLFISVEKDDETSPGSVADQLAGDIVKRAEDLDVRKIVLYPYVHLTDAPASHQVALECLTRLEHLLTGTLDVVRAPFGWYKAFEMACLGHPLSEWSGRYVPSEESKTASKKDDAREPSQFTRFVLADLDGHTFDVSRDNFVKSPIFQKSDEVYGLLKQFVSNEFGLGKDTEIPPRHIEYMLNHELLDYCDVSEKGHFKWYPKGLLIQKLLLDYASRMARDWGAIEMKNPTIIRGDHNVVGELMGEFHERDYQVDGGRGICYLRYASDPLAFPFMQKVGFSHKQTPLKVYEETSCFRNEQQGEVSGLKRVRNFIMTDMHAACDSVEQAREEFEYLCRRFADLMNQIIAQGRWALGGEGTREFFNQTRDWLVGIGQSLGVPAFFKLMPQMSHYYAIKNEFQAITEDRSNVQVSTVQWDVKDGPRFDIGFVDERGEKIPCPVIVHASSFGSIERALCAILENIAIDEGQGRVPAFPLWLSPVQVRIVPVSDGHIKPALDICDRLSEAGIRADIDDRDGTVGRKIRDGEMEWVPYLVVMGDRERKSGLLPVRCREEGKQEKMSLDQLEQRIADKTKGMPGRPLPLPVLISRRPVFSR